MSKTESRTEEVENSAARRILDDPVSRRKFMALTGGTASLSVLIAACGDDDDEDTSTSSSTETATSDDALAQFGEGDLGIVNYALTLEYLEAAFYSEVAASGLFKGADLALIEEFGKNEAEHVTALTSTVKTLGGKPAPIPKVQFDLTDAATVLQTAADVENLGAAAYLGQAAAIESPDVLAAALSIHTVEARHAAALNTLTDQPITPDGPFAVPADAQTVLDSVQPFIVS
ncbi:MAG: ferritin-like domain-containing protein [Solirubrobacterales bacterium]|nr:ferritin-like domain-containing protein [Solirubrobacterales bacterium]